MCIRDRIERLRAERGVESLFGGSKCAGRSVIANVAASSELQRESRAAHVTAKAMSLGPCSGVKPERSLRGMGGGTYTGSGTEQERPVCACLVRRETAGISRW